MAKIEEKNENCKDLQKNLQKRAKNKWFGYHLASLLYYNNPKSVIRDSYQNTLYCCDELYQREGVITSKWCKNRWCPSCQRNKMAEMIEAYAPRLRQEKNLYFVTLTRPNVRAEQLSDELKTYQNLWRKIVNTKVFRKAMENGLIGIRKLECTYHATQYILKKHEEWRVNKEGKKYKYQRFEVTDHPDPFFDTYHPHLHLLVNSLEMARYIRDKWLQLNPTSRKSAQDIRKVVNERKVEVRDEKGCLVLDEAGKVQYSVIETSEMLEIFKYFTKLIAKDSKGKRYVDPIHMNVIFEAMRGKRVYFRIGRKDNWGNEEVDETTGPDEALLEAEDKEWHIYRWNDAGEFFGYYDVDSGETLIEITAPKNLMSIINH